MSANDYFLNAPWIWPVLAGSILIWAVFIWKEWPGRGKELWRFYVKVSVALLGVFSLAILALRPLVSSTLTGERLAILTPGYENANLDSLKKVHRNITIIPYRPNEPLFSKTPRSSVYILGNGLEPYDLWQMDSVRALHMPGKSPEGVLQFSYEQETAVGERAVFRGRYANMKKGQKLVLEGAGGQGLDSVVIDIPKKGAFQLSLEPKVAGNFLFYLVIKDSLGGVVSTDPIPVRVTEKEALDIFIVNGFPTFETKYLKNYLAESGHKVAVRSQLTRGRFKYEFFNRERSIIGNLSQKMLEEHDLLIMDANSFGNLTSAERSSILNAVRENGLGLFVQPDDAFFYDANKTPFMFVPDGNTVISLPKKPKMELEKFPYTFKGGRLLRPIHKTKETVLSAYYDMGAGRMGTTVLGATYGLLLEGKGDGYRLLWADIVSEMAKRKREKAKWESSSPWAYRDRPFTFGLWTSIPLPKVSTQEGVPIPMRQDIELEQLWTGTHYPRETGWHVQSVEQDTLHPFHYYVMDGTAWESMEMYNTLTQNQRHFQGSVMEDGQGAGARPLSPLWPFLVFLGCMAFLWLEPKLLGP